MSRFFNGLEPERVWYHFEEITKLPHGSRNEDAVRKYIGEFAKIQGLDCYYRPDAPGDRPGERNIVLYKKAAPGLEDKPTLVLQAHMDMVCVPDDRIFPLKLLYCGADGLPGDGWVKAGDYGDAGTTLGADNGIGIAVALAILEDNQTALGPIEVLLTVQEEVGLEGARDFDPGLLKGRTMINVDEIEVDAIIYGCAGGLTTEFIAPVRQVPVAAGTKCVALKVGGLKGGHSGVAIADGGANAIQLIAQILQRGKADGLRLNLATFAGGRLVQNNVIPANANATVIVRRDEAAEWERLVAALSADFKKAYQKADPDLQIEWDETELPAQMIDDQGTGRILAILTQVPHGVLKMVPSQPELIETSSNLASIGIQDGQAFIHCMHRSSAADGLDWMKRIHEPLAEQVGAVIKYIEFYPSWSPNPGSPLLQRAKTVYDRYNQGKARTIVIHAGLECGWLVEKYRNDQTPMECVAIGPNLVDLHSSRERVEIRSVQQFYRCVMDILKSYAV